MILAAIGVGLIVPQKLSIRLIVALAVPDATTVPLVKSSEVMLIVAPLLIVSWVSKVTNWRLSVDPDARKSGTPNVEALATRSPPELTLMLAAVVGEGGAVGRQAAADRLADFGHHRVAGGEGHSSRVVQRRRHHGHRHVRTDRHRPAGGHREAVGEHVIEVGCAGPELISVSVPLESVAASISTTLKLVLPASEGTRV